MTGAVVLLACNDDKPKQQAKAPPSAEPIPTDLVYNSFFDDKSAAQKLTVVNDSGAASDASVAAGSSAKLSDPGADPKAALAYAFSTKARTVIASIKMNENQGGQSQEQTFKFTFTATPKPKFGLQGAATIDLKVVKLEFGLPSNAPPQAAQMKDVIEKAIVGVAGHFDATSHGDIDNLDFENDKVPQGAGELVAVMEQSIEFLILPLPNEPVGIGAKWTKADSRRLADQGTTVSTTETMTLQARDATTATLKVDATSAQTVAVSDPRAPKGMSVQRNTTATYTVVIRLDGVSQKADGDAKSEVVQKAPGQPDQVASAKVTQSLTSN